MGAKSSSASSGQVISDINVTPLVDVMLVLLVLMMMTATAIASRSIAIELPKTKSGARANDANQPLVVTIDPAGAFYVEDRPVDDQQLRALAKSAVTKDPKSAARLQADGRARHESVVRALDILRDEHVSKLEILVRPREAGAR